MEIGRDIPGVIVGVYMRSPSVHMSKCADGRSIACELSLLVSNASFSSSMECVGMVFGPASSLFPMVSLHLGIEAREYSATDGRSWAQRTWPVEMFM